MTISGGSALPKEEIDRMVKDAEAHAAEDKTAPRGDRGPQHGRAARLLDREVPRRQRRQVPADGRGDVDAALADLKDGAQGRLRRHRGHRGQVGDARPRSPRSWARRCTPPPSAEDGGCRFASRATAGAARWPDRRRRRTTTSSTPRSSTTTRPRTRSDPARRQHARGAGRRQRADGPAGAGDPRQAPARPGDRRGACRPRTRPAARPRWRTSAAAGEPADRQPADPVERWRRAEVADAAPRHDARGRAARATCSGCRPSTSTTSGGSTATARSHRDVAVGSVLEALLPVLDDIHPARQHGDLEGGPFAAIADKLEAILGQVRRGRASASRARRSTRRTHEALMHVEAELAEGTDGDHGRPGAPARLPDRRAGHPRGAGRGRRPASRDDACRVRGTRHASDQGTLAGSREQEGRRWPARTGSRRTSTRSSASPGRRRRGDQEGLPQARAQLTPTPTPGTPRPSSGSRRSARRTPSSPTPSSASSTTPSAR